MVTALTATTPPLSESCQQLFSNWTKWDKASLTELGTGELCATKVDHLDITETPQKNSLGTSLLHTLCVKSSKLPLNATLDISDTYGLTYIMHFKVVFSKS